MIDATYEMHTDTPAGRDPDQHSPTLRAYHARLWSKQLPDGRPFALSTSTPSAYLHHLSGSQEFILASDAIGHTYRHSKLVAPVIAQVPDIELDEFFAACSTIGAYTVFPARMIDRKPTINMARGLHPRIGDRFDLTLECIRRHYSSEESPLSEALARYSDFFELFGSFSGYVEFFHLQDLLSEGGGPIRFFLPATGFEGSPYPVNLDSYRTYRDAVMAFISGRNARITEAVTTS